MEQSRCQESIFRLSLSCHKLYQNQWFDRLATACFNLAHIRA